MAYVTIIFSIFFYISRTYRYIVVLMFHFIYVFFTLVLDRCLYLFVFVCGACAIRIGVNYMLQVDNTFGYKFFTYFYIVFMIKLFAIVTLFIDE